MVGGPLHEVDCSLNWILSTHYQVIPSTNFVPIPQELVAFTNNHVRVATQNYILSPHNDIVGSIDWGQLP
jgi:hypothetical protein